MFLLSSAFVAANWVTLVWLGCPQHSAVAAFAHLFAVDCSDLAHLTL
jgi:hypothetical protein